jgi:phage terminase small subunit
VARLTEKQKRYIDFYIETGNQSEAARLAGYKSPYVQGAQLYEKLRTQIDERLSEIESDRIAKAQEVMEYLTSVMRREHKEVVVVTLKTETSEYVPDGAGTMRKRTTKAEEPELVEIPAKLSDANKAAELLGRRYGLFSDKLELSGGLDVHSDKLDTILEQLNE